MVFFSVTRSNPENRAGFLRALERINVALSRSMDLLVIVGDDTFVEHALTASSSCLASSTPMLWMTTSQQSFDELWSVGSACGSDMGSTKEAIVESVRGKIRAGRTQKPDLSGSDQTFLRLWTTGMLGDPTKSA